MERAKKDDLMEDLAVQSAAGEMILIIGVGGAGCNAIGNLWRQQIEGVSFIACNTDKKSLNINPVACKICIGEGLGSGNRPEKGRKAAIASLEDIRHQIMSSSCKMVFITAGMGGGTGTGASPVIAKLAKEMGLLTVAIVISPLADEGKIRWQQAMEAIAELEQQVDALLVIDNDNVVETFDDLPLHETFGRADDILATAAKGIAEIVTRESDLVGVDFADVSEVMRNCGRAHMSVSSAAGENRVETLLKSSFCSPLLGHTQIAGAKHILLNFSVSDPDHLKTREVKQVLRRVQQYASVKDEAGEIRDANVIWGTSVNPNLGEDVLELVVVATGFQVQQPERRKTVKVVDIPEQKELKQPKVSGSSTENKQKPNPENETNVLEAGLWERLAKKVTQFFDQQGMDTKF